MLKMNTLKICCYVGLPPGSVYTTVAVKACKTLAEDRKRKSTRSREKNVKDQIIPFSFNLIIQDMMTVQMR